MGLFAVNEYIWLATCILYICLGKISLTLVCKVYQHNSLDILPSIEIPENMDIKNLRIFLNVNCA